MNEKAIPFRQIEPGVIITQGRGGQAVIQDAAGNIFLTTQNKTGSNQTTLSVSDSISSILISNGETSSIIETRYPFSSNNFNTINFNPTSISQIQVIKPTFPLSQSLDVTVDILPTSSVTSSVQTQVVEEPKSNKEIELSFLPETEDIIFSPLYDENIIGTPLKLITSLISSFETLDNASPAENGSNNINGSYSTFTDNNPFNIINTNAQWKGKIGFKKASNSSLNFVVFDNIENGIRAALINLSGYFTRYKLNTVEKIINTYAPGGSPGQTTANTNLYIKNVTLYLQQNWNKNITSSTVLTFNGKNEINLNNIKMFKTLAKSILIIEGRANATPINFSIIDKFLIKNLN